MTAGARAQTRALRTPRERAYDRALGELREADQIRELPARCRALGLAKDPAGLAELIFRDLPYAPVMQLALRDPDVRAAVAMLPAGWRGAPR